MKTRVLLCVLAVISLSCSRDPQVVARRYVESGNRYFNNGKYKEASLMYRNAIQKLPRYGEAHYRMGLTAEKTGDPAGAIQSFRRATEGGSGLSGPIRLEAQLKLGRLLRLYVPTDETLQYLKTTSEEMLKANPNSFEGHWLQAEYEAAGLLLFANRNKKVPPDAEQIHARVVDALRKANAARPYQTELVVSLAQALTIQQKIPEAEQLLRDLLQHDKEAIPAYVQLSAMYSAQKKFNEAEQVLSQGVNHYFRPGAPVTNRSAYELLLAQAEVYWMQQRTADMVKPLDRIKSYVKDYPAAYDRVGSFYLRIGQPENAIRQFEEGIKAAPQQKVHFQKQIIHIYMLQRKVEAAGRVADEILKENPKDPDARGLKASMALGGEDVDSSIRELQEVVNQSQTNAFAKHNLGRAYLLKGDLERARQQFSEAARLRPDFLGPQIGLAQIHILRREFEAAETLAQQILKRDPRSVPARLVLSAANIGLKRPELARPVLKELLATNPNSADALFQSGAVSLQARDFKEAEVAFRKSYDANPVNLRGLLALVETQMLQNQIDRAVETLKAEIQKTPDRFELHGALGTVYTRGKMLDQAAAAFKTAAEKAGDNKPAAADMYSKVAETERAKGNWAAAVAMGEKAREMNPSGFRVLASLALIYDAAGRKQDARSVYDAALKADPNNVVILNNYAYLLAESGGNLDQALTYAQRARQARPDIDEVADTLGWIYLKKQLTEDALGLFQQLVSKQPANPNFRYHLAMALDQKGDRTEARKHFELALKNNPNKDVEENIRRILARN
ncbi:MAG: tetratricopeptide repeat protein [Bryobacterales bacterium]|nr:tetratricopeptide repeat protein [Bryobacterales bacterium]